MSVIRVLAIVSMAAALGACSPASTRFGADDAPSKSVVESKPLPPPAEGVVTKGDTPPTAAPDAWRPYAASKARSGKWTGSTAWKYPPQQRSEATPVPAQKPLIAAPSAPDRRWADKWVSPADLPGFDLAIKTSLTGKEGKWTTDKGAFGTAFPAARAGKCSTVEVMISPASGGLPITTRGSIIECS